MSTVPSAGLTKLATVGWAEPLFIVLASVRSGSVVTTAWVEEGATVELFVVLDVCVLEVTGARFDFLLSGEEVVGAESFVFFFFRRPPNVGIVASRKGGGGDIGYRRGHL